MKRSALVFVLLLMTFMTPLYLRSRTFGVPMSQINLDFLPNEAEEAVKQTLVLVQDICEGNIEEKYFEGYLQDSINELLTDLDY